MARDDLDDRVRQAAEAEPQAVERVVNAVLARGGAGSPGWRRAGYAGLGACVISAAALVVWWSSRETVALPAGVFRAEAVAPTLPQDSGVVPPTGPAGEAGVFRVTADRAVAPSRVIRLKVDDGTTWILSTEAHDDWPPPGGGVVVGGGGAR